MKGRHLFAKNSFCIFAELNDKSRNEEDCHPKIKKYTFHRV